MPPRAMRVMAKDLPFWRAPLLMRSVTSWAERRTIRPPLGAAALGTADIGGPFESPLLCGSRLCDVCHVRYFEHWSKWRSRGCCGRVIGNTKESMDTAPDRQ